jgi:MFS family permease
MTTPTLPRAFYVSLAATTLFSLGLTAMIPILPLFLTDELGLAEHWIGTATLMVAFTAVSLRVPAGTFSDRYGRRSVMSFGAALGVVAACVYVASETLIIFLAARLLTGASLALFTTTGKALAADLAPAVRRGEAMGLTNAAFSVATIVSPLLGEGLKNAVGFRAVFALSGFLMLAALAVTYTLPIDQPRSGTARNTRRDIQMTLYERGTWAAILLMMSMGSVLALMFTFYPLLAERKKLFADAPGVIAPVAIGLGLSIWAITDSLVEPMAGRISDRLSRQLVAIPGLVLAALGVVALSQARHTLGAYTAIAVLTAGWGIVRPTADSVLQDAVPPVLRGMGTAVIYTMFDLAVGLDAQVFGSLINDSDFSTFFGALLVVLLAFGAAGIALSTRLLTYEQRAARVIPPAPSTD